MSFIDHKLIQRAETLGKSRKKKNRDFIDVRTATGEVTEEFLGVGE